MFDHASARTFNDEHVLTCHLSRQIDWDSMALLEGVPLRFRHIRININDPLLKGQVFFLSANDDWSSHSLSHRRADSKIDNTSFDFSLWSTQYESTLFNKITALQDPLQLQTAATGMVEWLRRRPTLRSQIPTAGLAFFRFHYCLSAIKIFFYLYNPAEY